MKNLKRDININRPGISKVLLISSILIIYIFVNNSCNTFKYEESEKGNYIIAFYNTENLFDTIDDPDINDEDFHPESKISWNSERYNHKINNLSKVLTSIGKEQLPDLIGLCEIENKNVLIDLVNNPGLQQGQYKIIHKNSPDSRGIDVALLYRKKQFKPLYNEFIPIFFPFDDDYKTRDILYVKGIIKNDTVNIFVNHWPSRWGGQKESEPDRVYVASVLRKKVDSLFCNNPENNIVIMGDFNDNPDNKSIHDILNAKRFKKRLRYSKLYNLSFENYKNDEGTIYWKGWHMYDQFIVSSNLLNCNNQLFVSPPEIEIFKPDWILYTPRNGPSIPSRTKGRFYYGGYSDHLPVYIRLMIN